MATSGFGTTVSFNSASWKLLDVSGPSLAQETIDATHMASTSGWREFIDSLKDAGEITLEIEHDPGFDPKTTLIDAGKNTLTVTWPIADSDNTTNGTFACDAICTGYEPAAPMDDKMVANVTFKLSGVPTVETEAA